MIANVKVEEITISIVDYDVAQKLAGTVRARGLSNYQAFESATTNPARFLRVEEEFGTVSAGKRADLLLIKNNPLEDLETTRTPEGMRVRGTDFLRSKLRLQLEALSHPTS